MEKRFNGLIEGKDINSSPFDHDHESESSSVIALADALVLPPVKIYFQQTWPGSVPVAKSNTGRV